MSSCPVILPCCLILVAIVAILHVTCHVDPLGSMKRTSQDLTHYDFSRKFAGISMTVKTHPASAVGAAGQETLVVTKTCEACSTDIPGKPASCQRCDAGPYHEWCLPNHRCPGNEAVMGGAGSGLEGRHAHAQAQFMPFAPFANTEMDSWFDSPKGAGDRVLTEIPPLHDPRPMKSLKATTLAQFQMDHWKMHANKVAWEDEEGDDAEVDDPEEVEEARKQGEEDGRKSFEAFRDSQPTVKSYARGKAAAFEPLLHDKEAFDKALAEFEADKYAQSNRASHESRRKWWAEKASLLKVDPYPLTETNLEYMGTLLKMGRYRSSALYFSAAKQRHVELGHAWTDQLDKAIKDGVRSCSRGIGPDRSCPSFDLLQIFDMEQVDPVAGGPRFPRETVIVFAHFACREMEASLRRRSDLKFDSGKGCGTLSFWLPASKADPKGNGVLRRHGCACEVNPKRCVVKAAQVIYDHGTRCGADDADPFLGTEDHKVAPTKSAMIGTFRTLAKQLGWKEEQVKSMTGHVLRSTGAQYLAKCGIEFYKIQLFCRWGSDTVLRYLRDAPLEDSEPWIENSLRKASMTEVLCHTSLNINESGKPVSPKDVEKIVNSALEARSEEIWNAVAEKKDDLEEMIESLRNKKIEMDLHWAGELSRRFLPKFVVNLNSGKCHAVRDSEATGCGHVWRGSRDHDFRYEIDNNADLCDKSGCQRLFKRG